MERPEITPMDWKRFEAQRAVIEAARAYIGESLDAKRAMMLRGHLRAAVEALEEVEK